MAVTLVLPPKKGCYYLGEQGSGAAGAGGGEAASRRQLSSPGLLRALAGSCSEPTET